MITAAQTAAVAAANLPFDLSDADIERQWNPDGSPRPSVSRMPLARARELALQALDAVVAAAPLAVAA